MENKPTRAERMVEQYGAKLDRINNTPPTPRKIQHKETETLEMRTKRRIAVEKLSTFRDLLG